MIIYYCHDTEIKYHNLFSLQWYFLLDLDSLKSVTFHSMITALNYRNIDLVSDLKMSKIYLKMLLHNLRRVPNRRITNNLTKLNIIHLFIFLDILQTTADTLNFKVYYLLVSTGSTFSLFHLLFKQNLMLSQYRYNNL